MTHHHEGELLADAGVDLVGLWWAVPGGHAELSSDRVAELATTVRGTGQLAPVLVTFSADIERIVSTMRETGISWLQLHAYQPPAVVRELRRRLGSPATIVKVLHVGAGGCVEQRFVPAYTRAGADLFLVDGATPDGRLGSTGVPLDPAVVLPLVDSLDQGFLLAGGLTAANAGEYAGIAGHPRMCGIDVDTGARGSDGRFDSGQVGGLARQWRVGRREERDD
ncbi:hypothetical protein JQS43_11195 [Natronosporangium hydrolyticum]|uniref:N-(5'-phosphoribosyl)anthranilate isomerase n=1 Tax=Natronosporangium hydrolyticum TaxID=2811111 RepID=A0A895YGV7_9ACTN|nr:hypothetical protein [Natronosporangium hydrolyticum]QSB16791.1 hypothetical protein JQS43_11195 [Natronosporangium hydrolyticum]